MASSQACQHDSECKKAPITSCLGCLSRFCAPHLLAHRHVLEAQFQELFNERNSLAETLKTISVSDRSDQVYQLIDQWEKKQTEQLHDVAEQARATADRLIGEVSELAQQMCSEISSDLTQKFDGDDYHEMDIGKFRQQLQDLRSSFSNEAVLTFTAGNIQWCDLIRLALNTSSEAEQEIKDTPKLRWKPAPYREFNLRAVLRTKPRHTVELNAESTVNAVASDEGAVLWYDCGVAFYQKPKFQRLLILDRLATNVRSINWMHGEIGDIKCLAWSSLRREFILASTDGISTLNPKTLIVELVNDIESGPEYSSCAVSHDSLFLIVKKQQVQQRTMADWKLCRNWPFWIGNVCQIDHIAVSATFIALAITQHHVDNAKTRVSARIELRNHEMGVIRSLRTYENSIYGLSCLLHNGDWIVGESSPQGGPQLITVYNGEGLKKAVFNYKGEVKQLLVLDNQTIAVRDNYSLSFVDY